MKKTSPVFFPSLRWLAFFLLSIMLCACAAQRHVVFHSFEFSTAPDLAHEVKTDTEILAYRYGDSKQSGASSDFSIQLDGRSAQSENITGEMLVGDVLYVKWRDLNTDRIYEKTVELKGHLPEDMKGHRIYFTTRGAQLFVYLITPQRRGPNGLPNGPRETQYLKTITIYPSQSWQ